MIERKQSLSIGQLSKVVGVDDDTFTWVLIADSEVGCSTKVDFSIE